MANRALGSSLTVCCMGIAFLRIGTMPHVTLQNIRIHNDFMVVHCECCGYFHDLGASDLDHLPDEMPIKAIEKNLSCDRCNKVGLRITRTNYGSCNPYPGVVGYYPSPSCHMPLICYEPGTKVHERQRALLRDYGRR